MELIQMSNLGDALMFCIGFINGIQSTNTDKEWVIADYNDIQAGFHKKELIEQWVGATKTHYAKRDELVIVKTEAIILNYPFA